MSSEGIVVSHGSVMLLTEDKLELQRNNFDRGGSNFGMASSSKKFQPG
jgi:hypothetical protein